MNRHRVGCAVALATLWSTGAVAQQPGDAEVRIRQLEATVQQLMREIDTLKAALPAQPAAGAAPAADAAEEPSSEARRAQRLERRRVDDIQFDVQETRERVDAMQSRLDAQVPNARLENGLVIEDSRGRWALRVTGRAQMDYRSYDNDAVADTFGIRRARIGAGLTMGKFGALIETELTFGAVGGNNPTTVPQGSPTNAVLHQAYVDFNPFDALRFRLGQFKPAFGMENTMSTWAHDFQERSLAFGLMQNFLFDRGLMISGAPTPYTTYALSITNGTGQNVDEVQSSAANARVDGKDYIGRVTANFASLLDQPDWVLHGAANYRTGRIANNSNSGTADTLGANGYVGAAGVTESRGLVFFAPSPFNANPAVSGDVIDRTIWGLETAIAYRSVKLQGEYFRATYAGNRLSPGQPAFEPGIDAGYIAANWLITGEQFADSYRNGVFGRIRPNNAYATGQGGGWGAVELGLRYSFWDASSFGAYGGTLTPGNVSVDTRYVRPPATPVSSNLTRKAESYTVALKWMPTAYWAFMVNYVMTHFDTPITANGYSLGDERALTFRGQFDFY